MGLDVRINGAATLKRVAEQMRAEGNKGLAKEMSKALAEAVEPVKTSIAAEADQVMPDRGGYREAFSRSLRFRMSRRTSGREASVMLRTYADGTKERRDIDALEAGQLRHPIYGRSRRIRIGPRAGTAQPNPWAVTAIRPGFHQRGTKNAGDEAERQLLGVLDDFAARLAKG